MTQRERFVALVNLLERLLVPLKDKPDESADATARALWFAAADQPCSIGRAQREELPPLTEDGVLRLEQLVEKRLAGTPLAHLTGRQSFLGVELLAGPEALVPRRETEILAKAARDRLRLLAQERGRVRVIDVCTGSGNLALALAFHEPNALVFAADLSLEATALARRNVALHHMEDRVIVRHGDLFAPFSGEGSPGQVDMVVCNPPYISSGKLRALPGEISQHEPALAFDGGPLGVTILSRLLKEAPAFLKASSWLCFEIGLGQGDHFRRSLDRMPEFSQVETFADENGATRALAAQTHAGAD